VEPEADEPVFHSEWEGRIFGLVTSVKGGLSRPRLESLDPDAYLSGYYQRWMLAFERGLMARGSVRAQELNAKTEHFRRHPDARPTRRIDPALTARVRAGMYRQRDVRKTPSLVTGRAVGHTHASA
jgi:nitrile hydratase